MKKLKALALARERFLQAADCAEKALNGDCDHALRFLYTTLCASGLPECLSACIAAEVNGARLGSYAFLAKITHPDILPSEVLAQALPWRVWEGKHDKRYGIESNSTCFWQVIFEELSYLGL